MSAVVLGKRNSSCFFEELNHHPAAGATTVPPSPSASKKARFASSPSCLSPRSSPSSVPDSFLSWPSSDCITVVNRSSGAGDSLTLFDHLRSLFPEIEEQVLERELEAYGNDLDSAIKSLEEFRCRSTKENFNSEVSETACCLNLPAGGSEWVEQLVREMMNATDINDARARASSVLEVLEKSIMAEATTKAAQSFGEENMILKEQVEGLLRDNNILKRAVAIQHERQRELQMKALQGNQELQHLRELVAQYQQQIQTLEINNYSLSMHLRQAQQGSSMPGRFHPDIF
ncbi:unnamed protein product [Spirodela intermedia]|uniref:CUE domain-containing protein n=1 Tax=Spirodela intermedia TaxID=51605 RepID=A0A7I8KJ60_SPIIN|nr:unnamed protein product [Spirodela intermedia]